MIVVYAGNENGFVEITLLMFQSGSKSGDYHSDMNVVNFSKWFEEMLIPNLPKNSIVVLDYCHTITCYVYSTQVQIAGNQKC